MNKLIKKYISFGVLIGLVWLNSGCKDYFDLGNNPNLITTPNINSLLSTATSKAAVNSRNYASISAYYTQYLASPTEGAAGDTYQITDPSGTWGASYYAMADLQDMIKMAEESGAYLHLGVGKILMAYNLSLVADSWDSAPYSEAFMKENTLTPAYESGESLYQTTVQLLKDGISDLQRTDASVDLDKNLDLIHGGNKGAWIKTGYGLLARQLNKITRKSNYDANAVLAALDNSYKSSGDDMKMGVYVGNNYWAGIAISNAGALLGGWLSEQLINHLNGTNYGFVDPRLYKITDATVHGNYVGTRNGRGNVGAANTIWDECYISVNCPITAVSAPIYIMTYEELKYVEAEAALRAGNKTRAYNAYIEGIKANMAKLQVPQNEADTYMARPSVAVGADKLTLDDIFREKYVATYLNFEAWNDARRYDYKYKGFQLPYNASLTKYIRQVSIPTSETATNNKNVPAQGSLDVPLWWDK